MDIHKLTNSISQIRNGSTLSENELDALIKQYPFASALYAMRSRAQVESGQLSSTELSKSALHFSTIDSFLNSCIAVNNSEVQDQINQLATLSAEEQSEEQSEVKHGSHLDIAAAQSTQIDVNSNLAKDMEQPAEHPAEFTTNPKDEEIKAENHPEVLIEGPKEEAGSDESLSQKESTLLDLAHLSEYGSWLLQLKDKKPKQSTTEPDGLIPTRHIDSPRDTNTALKQGEGALIETTQSEQKVDVSSRLNDQIASESLANLLAEQGYHKKAIDMYKKLSLIIPEKSTYFATQIEKIKRK